MQSSAVYGQLSCCFRLSADGFCPIKIRQALIGFVDDIEKVSARHSREGFFRSRDYEGGIWILASSHCFVAMFGCSRLLCAVILEGVDGRGLRAESYLISVRLEHGSERLTALGVYAEFPLTCRNLKRNPARCKWYSRLRIAEAAFSVATIFVFLGLV